MKLERLHESVLSFVVLAVGLGLAVVAGSAAGSGKTGTVGMIIVGILTLAFMLIVGQRVWMLIPATMMLGSRVVILPLPFTIYQLGVLFAFGTFLLLKAFKIVRLRPKFDFVDFWLLLVVIYLATVFLRNPVGVDALGSDRVGGRPYFDVLIACCAFWVLSRSLSTAKDAFYVPFLTVAGYGFHFAMNFIADLFPSTVVPLSRFYSAIAAAEALETGDIPSGENYRLAYMSGLGGFSFLAACSYWRPVTVINPMFIWRFLVFLFATILTLLSGFRTAILSMIISFSLGTYFRRGFLHVAQGIVMGLVALGVLILMQGTVVNLPMPAQRALSFLPGKWDYAARDDAQGSTEWRTEMWKRMLTGNKYIANKWLGDGFGFTRHQLEIMTANIRTGTTADQQENLLISGGVHSGPISTIRFVGYLGLALYLIFIFLLARRAVLLIRRATDTPFYPLTLFYCIPMVATPLTFVFIYGAYDSDLPGTIMLAGIQKMVSNSLDAYEESQKGKNAPAAPGVTEPKFRRPAEYAAAARLR